MIICEKCNAEIEDGGEFCSECGHKIPQVSFCAKCGEKLSADDAFCQGCGASAGDAPAVLEVVKAGQISVPGPTQKKAFPIKPVAIAACLVVVVGALFMMLGKGGGSTSSSVLYVKDDEINFTYLSKIAPFELTSRFSDSDYEISADDFASEYVAAVFLKSEDGRYLFYPDRMQGESATYYYRDLKADNTKSDAAVKVDSEIDLDSTVWLSKDGMSFIYIKGDDRRLYIFNTKTGEKEKIDDGVAYFYMNDAEDYLVYVKYNDNYESTIYEATIKGTSAEKAKVDSGAYIQDFDGKTGTMVYIKNETLYIKERGKDKIKVASDVQSFYAIASGNALYYTKSEEASYGIDDYLDDDKAAADSSLREPEIPLENMFGTRRWIADPWGNDWNSERQEWGRWDGNVDYEAFYQAVRDYEAARVEYQAKLRRDELRNEIYNSASFEARAINLYYYDGADSVKVADDITGILSASSKAAAVLYAKYETSEAGSKIKLSEITSAYDVYNRITSDREIADELYLSIKGNESSFEPEDGSKVYSAFFNSSGSAVYYLDDYSTSKNYGSLMRVDILKDGISKPEQIDEDVTSYRFGNDSDKVYYMKDEKNYSGDLYSEGKLIASDVYRYGVYSFKGSDTLVYYSDYSDRNEAGTLYIYKGGTATRIADDVSYFVVEGENEIVYLTDYNRNREKGDAILYNGSKEAAKVDEDVKALIWDSELLDMQYFYSVYY